jgi:hypothetical protein
MTKSETALVIEVFPESAAAIRRLYLSNPSFRDLCSDFTLAVKTLDGFERRIDAAQRPEIAEYQDIVHCLKTDIAEWLRRAERSTPGGATP